MFCLPSCGRFTHKGDKVRATSDHFVFIGIVGISISIPLKSRLQIFMIPPLGVHVQNFGQLARASLEVQSEETCLLKMSA